MVKLLVVKILVHVRLAGVGAIWFWCQTEKFVVKQLNDTFIIIHPGSHPSHKHFLATCELDHAWYNEEIFYKNLWDCIVKEK